MTAPFHEAIVVDDVAVDFNDPNIRGATGSVMHAGTDGDRDDFQRWLKEGTPYEEAVQNLARRIARRSQLAMEAVQEVDMRTFTLMLPGDPNGEMSKRPHYVIANSTYIYTQLSTKRGRSPQFYWSPGVSFLMLENWTQIELDVFASFRGVAAVVSMELSNEGANALIDLANSNTVRNTVPLPTRS